ncbi:DnaJ domain-containing protein [uncultured Clostridium sp.]|uniref:J domain-containing protein n=1 Tax=uncultured Clostridium sp. TaxID=59620 RepID=UPI00262F602D|nr:DnaJ domain-containing protein [uncultured Clostridium sp.]
MEINLYDILEISKISTVNEIKKSYANMLRKYPPEKFNDKFSEINKAYETLIDEERRYKYDQLNGYSEKSQRLLDEGLEHIRNGEIKIGKKKIYNFLKIEGEVPYVLNELAKVYEIEEEYELAYEKQKKVLEKGKFVTFEQIDNMITYLYKLEKEEKLNFYMKKAILKFKNIETYFNIINLYIEDKKFDKANDIVLNNVIPFLSKQSSFEGYINLSKIGFKMGDNKKGICYLMEALNLETEYSREVEKKLNIVKSIIVEELNFKNAEGFMDVLKDEEYYLIKVKCYLEEEEYRMNLKWMNETTRRIKKLIAIDKSSLQGTLKKFLLASSRKRIAINEEEREEIDEEVAFYLEKLKEEDRKKLKKSLRILEKFHNEIYRLDARGLFDKYGGFIPYDELKRKK